MEALSVLRTGRYHSPVNRYNNSHGNNYNFDLFLIAFASYVRSRARNESSCSTVRRRVPVRFGHRRRDPASRL